MVAAHDGLDEDWHAEAFVFVSVCLTQDWVKHWSELWGPDVPTGLSSFCTGLSRQQAKAAVKEDCGCGQCIWSFVLCLFRFVFYLWKVVAKSVACCFKSCEGNEVAALPRCKHIAHLDAVHAQPRQFVLGQNHACCHET